MAHPPLRWVAASFRGDGARVRLLTAVLAAAAIGLYITALEGFAPIFHGPRIPWWLLAVAFILTEAYPVHLHFRSETHSLSFSELAIVLGLFLATPGSLLLGYVGGSLVALVFIRKQRLHKVAFNVAQFALSTGLAIVSFHVIVRFGNPHGPVGWVAAAAGAATFGLVSVVLVTVLISILAGGPELRELPKNSALALAGSLASASLAVAAVELIEADRRAIWLMIVPVACWAIAFRAYGAQRRRHEHLEFLYSSMRATQGAPEFRSAARELLDSARAMLSADYAEVLLFGTTPEEGALRSVIGAGDETLMEPVALSEADELALRTASLREAAILLPRGREPHALDGYLAERRLDDALVTTLRRDNKIFGLLLVGDRSGDVSTFSADDRTLFETFAGHAGVLLENDRVKEQLRHQAFHDALTGLPNRVLFAERITRSLALEGVGPSVLFLDLDDFKTINDTLGHSAGDDLLAAVAERVRGCVRPGDVAARLGGDEFAVLLEREQELGAAAVAERLVDSLSAPFVIHGREIAVHTSIGIAGGSSGAMTADELLRNADIAMYDAKAAGKRRYATYEPEMHVRLRRRHELSAALERSVDRGEIAVHYQPIVSLADGRTVALEALVRWQHPTRGLILPGRFLPQAEENGLMVPIGRAVLLEACTRVSEWKERSIGPEKLAISVNLSASELLTGDITGDVVGALASSGLEPESLILEITESVAMTDPVATLSTLNALRKLGVRLALDDFGTGYSSLSHLRDFPFDILKIAKPFVDRLDRESADSTFTDAILRLATALDLVVVAEGIERSEQANVLRRLDCALGQGYYFARPLDTAAVEQHLAPAAVAAPALRRLRVA